MTLAVYTADGTPYHGESAGSDLENRIVPLARTGVRLAIEWTSTSRELIAQISARDTPAATPTQYYAAYTLDEPPDDLWRSFKEKVRRTLGDDLGMELVAPDETALFPMIDAPLTELTGDQAGLRVSSRTQRALLWLFRRDESLQYRVPERDTALAITKALHQQAETGSIAISETGRDPALSSYTLVLEPDAATVSDLDPVGETERKMQTARQELTDNLINEHLDELEETVTQLLAVGRSEKEIRMKVWERIPELAPDGFARLDLPGIEPPTLIRVETEIDHNNRLEDVSVIEILDSDAIPKPAVLTVNEKLRNGTPATLEIPSRSAPYYEADIEIEWRSFEDRHYLPATIHIQTVQPPSERSSLTQ